MCLGLTLTYITTKVANFAHGALVTVAAYLVFTAYRFGGISPYVLSPLSFVVVGAVDLLIYKAVLKPLIKKEFSTVTLMIGTLAVDIFLIGVFGIYADYLVEALKVYDSRFFVLIGADVSILGIKGLEILGPVISAASVLLLHTLLTRTKFGLTMRATVENPSLAAVFGIDTETVYTISWFLAGGLAGLAGSLAVFWLPGNPSLGDSLLPGIFAGSLVGGLYNLYGAVAGGVIVGVGQTLVPVLLATVVGPWIISYNLGIPLIIMVATLLLVPRGITSLPWRKMLRLRR